jgi:alpha/beta superfamily hydrolase
MVPLAREESFLRTLRCCSTWSFWPSNRLNDLDHGARVTNSPPQRPLQEKLFIPGPVGQLEAIVETPPGATFDTVGVLCHPHPQFGGTMTNKVIHMLAKTFNELGLPSVRFNYRGVGASDGEYAQGDGETDDSVAVIDWARERWPSAHIWVGGFSFGGAVAIRAAVRRDVSRLMTVAPAIDRVPVDVGRLPTCPWLIVQGDKDELVDAQHVRRWVDSLSVQPTIVMLEGVEHYFHGRMNDLRETVLDWVRGA